MDLLPGAGTRPGTARGSGLARHHGTPALNRAVARSGLRIRIGAVGERLSPGVDGRSLARCGSRRTLADESGGARAAPGGASQRLCPRCAPLELPGAGGGALVRLLLVGSGSARACPGSLVALPARGAARSAIGGPCGRAHPQYAPVPDRAVRSATPHFGAAERPAAGAVPARPQGAANLLRRPPVG